MTESHTPPTFSLVVRALIFQEGHLLVSRWQDGYCFPVGGQIEPGETLEQAVLREVFEETGVEGRIRRLVYFNENLFIDRSGNSIHELGWYFWVETARPIGRLGERWSHPDSPNLLLECIPLDRLEGTGLMPPFLEQVLREDLAGGFEDGPRHVLSRERPGQAAEVRTLNDGGPGRPRSGRP